MNLLEVRSLSKRFGGVAAVDDVSFDLPEGIVMALIGPWPSGSPGRSRRSGSSALDHVLAGRDAGMRAGVLSSILRFPAERREERAARNAALAGLNESETTELALLVRGIFRTLREINPAGATILLVEQNAHAALALADRAYVLATGSVVLEGPLEALREDPGIRKAYLGG